MKKVIYENKMPQFATASEIALDRVFGNAAIDIVRLSKMQVPHDQGTLQSSAKITRKGMSKFEIAYSTPYARRWEYNTPPGGFKKGRKSRYLRDPAEMIADPSTLSMNMRAESIRIRL